MGDSGFRIARARRRRGNRERLHPTGDGHYRLRIVRARRPRRSDRRGPAALAGTPDAVHVRRDDRAARPEFLNVPHAANAKGIAAGKIPGIDPVGAGREARMNAQARRRPSAAARRRYRFGRGLQRLCDPQCRRPRLRAGSGRRQRTNAGKNRQCRRSPDPHHDAYPNGCGAQGLRLPRQGQPRAHGKTACMITQHALNRRNVDLRDSTFACRYREHGA
jgi:hypothetical protein